MVLTLDIGNTYITMGVVDTDRTVFSARLSTARNRTADEYAVLLRLVAQQYDFSLHTAEGAILSSVVPQLTPVLREAVRTASGLTPLVVGPGVKSGLNIRIDDPSELGADFVAAAVAACAAYPLPCITIDMGTATALGVLDGNGTYIGGAISPGVMVSLDALAAATSQLPLVSLEAPHAPIGRSTASCMKSGLVFGTAAMLDGLISRFEEQLGSAASVVATGDWAEAIIPHCRREGIVIDQELVMRGLWLIWNKNKRGT